MLDADERLIIDTKAGLSTGGDAYEITDLVRSDLKRIAEKVATIAPGLDVTGVDILANDHFNARSELNYIIVEANTRPNLSGHIFPDYGRPNYVHRKVAEYCYKKMGHEIPKPQKKIRLSEVSKMVTDTSSRDFHKMTEVSLVFGGDTSLGYSYIQKNGDAKLKKRLIEAPLDFFDALMPLISENDHFVLNLETVLAQSAKDIWGGKKNFLGLDDPCQTVSALKTIGVDSVSVANNHTLDYGVAPFLETLNELQNSGINTFGGGRNRQESLSPLILPTNYGNIYIFGGFEFRRNYQENFKFYSELNRPGVQRFSLTSESRLSEEIRTVRKNDHDSFIVVFPHWGGAKNYAWANRNMLIANTSFMKAGADIVLGHGAHMLQQCWVEDGNTTVFSLGNFVFNSPGRYQKVGAPPYSAVARLNLKRIGEKWAAGLRLYPVVSDNKVTNYQPRPVSEIEMVDVFNALTENGQRIFQQSYSLGQDKRGFFLERRGPVSRKCI
ncbi:hypothetical protein GV827_18060 [Sulfitobacter sp. JBTF-M27]|uniref:Capsule synthesis protein CapA domain-containing protein n=1 Tax=Sulfitobacter sediminilitoris TaxID=2698830 RepID=A0A6P0CIH3_9RHOB|nr:CapA family protein [Sulfitobacter sediminilitoris]NEK24293.1 hypothetical protein [Sulfitobacter sediminilitoris]